MAENPLLTAQDLLERLLSNANKGPSGFDRDVRTARRSVIAAVRRLPTLYPWGYYVRDTEIQTVAIQTDGTIEYDASTGILTLDDAEWPDDVRLRRLLIAGQHYDVAGLVNATQIQLGPIKPVENIVADTTYVLYRQLYELPIDMQFVYKVWDWQQQQEMRLLTAAEEARNFVYRDDVPTLPRAYSLRNKREYVGSQSLFLVPPPNDSRMFVVQYQGGPRPIGTFLYSTGTVATNDTNIVTLTGGVFPENCVGAVLRISENSSVPTPQEGGYNAEELNPFSVERIIEARLSSTTVQVDAAVSTASGKGFTISSLIDIDFFVMQDLLDQMCMHYFRVYIGAEYGAQQAGERDMTRALNRAIEIDSAQGRYTQRVIAPRNVHPNTPSAPEAQYNG